MFEALLCLNVPKTSSVRKSSHCIVIVTPSLIPAQFAAGKLADKALEALNGR